MSVKVCVLSDSEAVTFGRSGIRPDCSKHGHMKRSEAEARTTGPNPRAEWIERRAIRILKPTGSRKAWPWKARHSGPRPLLGGPEFRTLQLLD